MKKTITFFLILAFLVCKAQNIAVDIDEQTQNKALAIKEKKVLPELEEYDFFGMDFVDIDYRIPAYGLYNELWDNEHLRSVQIGIPFSDNTLRIILLESHNTPFVFPCRGSLSLIYGKTKKNILHTGVDFLLHENDPVYACFDGVVRMAREYGDYGKMVVIRHYNGLETVYAHLSKIQVRENQLLKAGHTIGFAGKTGNTQEVLLHLETRFMNEHFNPALMINLDTRTLRSNILTLTPTDFFILPVSSSTIPVVQQPAATSQEPPQPKEAPKYHIVQKGETLYRIANQYAISIEELMKLNRIKNATQIQAGQKLIVK
jgi:murein DD-endopeptidase MepM/ murein hydrolase activator NlpD